ncbi:MAG TPA: ABC transporter permease [Marinagarivorans sp.]
MWDTLQEIFYTLKQNSLRTFLTGFGVFWGIFMLVLLLGVGKGLKNGIEDGFSSDVRTSMWINAWKTSVPYKGLAHGRDIQLVERDIAALKNAVPEIDLIAAEQPMGSVWQGDIYIAYQQKSGSFSVFGVGDGYFKIKKYQDYHHGRRLNDFDEQESRKVVVIGTRVAERLFEPDVNPVGKQIAINGVSVKVIGVFYDSGWEGQMSERIYMPLAAYQKTFGRGNDISIIALVPKAGSDNKTVAEKVLKVLKERHNVAPSDDSAIRLFDLAEQSQEVSNTFNAISLFIWFVGLGTLTAGVVGISNIMIISVKERTREIGIRKALGAPPGEIIRTIMSESLLVTLLAGYIGLVFSVGLLELFNMAVAKFAIAMPYFSRPEVDIGVALIALLILVSVGAVAGIVPAWHAARVSPIEAMREE